MENKFESVAIEQNNKGEVMRCFSVITKTKDECNKIRKQATDYQKKVIDAERKALEERKKEQEIENKHKENLKIINVYSLFNEFVERGEMETNEEFETMFVGWLKGENEFNYELMPQDYNKIYERV